MYKQKIVEISLKEEKSGYLFVFFIGCAGCGLILCLAVERGVVPSKREASSPYNKSSVLSLSLPCSFASSSPSAHPLFPPTIMLASVCFTIDSSYQCLTFVDSRWLMLTAFKWDLREVIGASNECSNLLRSIFHSFVTLSLLWTSVDLRWLVLTTPPSWTIDLLWLYLAIYSIALKSCSLTSVWLLLIIFRWLSLARGDFCALHSSTLPLLHSSTPPSLSPSSTSLVYLPYWQHQQWTHQCGQWTGPPSSSQVYSICCNIKKTKQWRENGKTEEEGEKGRRGEG